MFRHLLGHLQALWKNRSKSYIHFNALRDPKCLQIVLYECEIHKLDWSVYTCLTQLYDSRDRVGSMVSSYVCRDYMYMYT